MESASASGLAQTLAETCRAEAARLGFPFVDLDSAVIPPEAVAALPEGVARENRVVPVALEGDTLTVAMANPRAAEALDRLRFLLNRPIHPAMAVDGAIAAAIERLYPREGQGASESRTASGKQTRIDFVELPSETEEPEPAPSSDWVDPDGPAVIHLVQSMIGDALRLGASRVLVLPVRDHVKLAYRIEDEVFTRSSPPRAMLDPLVVRLMTMANFAGIIKVFLGKRERRLRVSFRPTQFGLAALVEVFPDPAAADAFHAKSERLGIPTVSLERLDIPRYILDLLPEGVARQFLALPIAEEGEAVRLAVADAPSPEALERLQFVLNRPLVLSLAPEGSIHAALERYFGQTDGAIADLMLWNLAQTGEAANESGVLLRGTKPDERMDAVARPLLNHLRTIFQDKVFELFDQIRSGPRLCEPEAGGGGLAVVFSQATLLPHLPPAGRRYVERKIWAIRVAVLSRLELLLEQDALARGMAMAFSQYLAARKLAEGETVSIDPNTARDVWINFVYGMAVFAFPAIDSNGAMLQFVNNQVDQISAKLGSLLDDPQYARQPQEARSAIVRLASRMSNDEGLDPSSPPITHLVDLLLGEAFHCRASRVLILPMDDRIEVAYRVQKAVYSRDSLPLRFLYPLLARLRSMASATGEFHWAVDGHAHELQLGMYSTQHGLAAIVDFKPDMAAMRNCRGLAAQHAYPFQRLDDIDVPPELLKAVPQGMAWRKVLLPISFAEGVVTVALSKPPTRRRLDELRLLFNRPVMVALAVESDVLAAIYRHYHPTSAMSSEAVAMLLRRPRESGG